MTRHVHAFLIQRESGYQQWLEDPSALVPLSLGIVDTPSGVRLGREHPTIVVRHPSRNDDSRTIIAAALGESGEIYNAGSVHAIRTAPDVDRDSLLALLAYLNTMTCDWWARRIVDRHVTAPVLNNLPLPDWGDAEILLVSKLASEILVRRGTFVLPGGFVLGGSAEFSAASDEELTATLELLAAQGFDLSRNHMEIILSDFSDNSCPSSTKEAIVAGFA